MAKLYPRIDFKKVRQKKSFKRAETVFLKHITPLKMFPLVMELREVYSIHPSGFTDREQLKMWLDVKGQEKVIKKLYSFIDKLLKEKELPEYYIYPFLDYVLSGFRFNVFFTEDKQIEYFCKVEKKGIESGRKYLLVKIYEEAGTKDVKDFADSVEKIKKEGKRLSSFKEHNRHELIRYYKSLPKQKLRNIMELYEEDGQVIGISKLTVAEMVARIMRLRHNIPVSVESVLKV